MQKVKNIASDYTLVVHLWKWDGSIKFTVGYFHRKVDFESKNENKVLCLLAIFYCENTSWRGKI